VALYWSSQIFKSLNASPRSQKKRQRWQPLRAFSPERRINPANPVTSLSGYRLLFFWRDPSQPRNPEDDLVEHVLLLLMHQIVSDG
jgi:hypothetical protein